MARFASLVLAVLIGACTGGSSGGGGRSTTAAAKYGNDAQSTYEAALLRFRKDDCIGAAPQFRRVRSEFPYSRFAALAELRLADCKLKEGNHAEAIQAYRQFLRGHPSHKQVPYARFKVAEGYYQQIPGGWFMKPPTHERDQSATRDALIQLRRFIVDFPSDNRVPEANKMVEECLKILAAHELYVARFYLRRDAYAGVIARLKSMLVSYAGSGLEPEALLLLGKVYLKADEPEAARETFAELVERFPESKEANEALPMLRKLTPS